jgi:hypothetical protein
VATSDGANPAALSSSSGTEGAARSGCFGRRDPGETPGRARVATTPTSSRDDPPDTDRAMERAPPVGGDRRGASPSSMSTDDGVTA